jgi:hypothetical protein
LPADLANNVYYRLRSAADGHERVARETEIVVASR